MLCKGTHPNENEKLGVCEKNGPNFPHFNFPKTIR
jgi:hypothetical protein